MTLEQEEALRRCKRTLYELNEAVVAGASEDFIDMLQAEYFAACDDLRVTFGDYEDVATVYQDASGSYRWRLVARNNQIISHGEAHPRKADAVRAAHRAKTFGAKVVVDE